MKAALWALALTVMTTPALAEHGVPIVACKSWLVAYELSRHEGDDRELWNQSAVERAQCERIARVGCYRTKERPQAQQGLGIMCIGPSRYADECVWVVTEDMNHADMSDGEGGGCPN